MTTVQVLEDLHVGLVRFLLGEDEPEEDEANEDDPFINLAELDSITWPDLCLRVRCLFTPSASACSLRPCVLLTVCCSIFSSRTRSTPFRRRSSTRLLAVSTLTSPASFGYQPLIFFSVQPITIYRGFFFFCFVKSACACRSFASLLRT
jgi:hypothetical protein